MFTVNRSALMVLTASYALYGGVAIAQSSGASKSAEPQADFSSVIPAEMTARYAKAKWTYPSGSQMANTYPLEALNANLSGVTVIACTVMSDGNLDRCGIEAEAPKGYGFGLATAKMFIKYAHVAPATVEGGIKPGDFKVFVYKWVVN